MRIANHISIILFVAISGAIGLALSVGMLLSGLEESAELLTDPQTLRESYLRAVKRFSERVKSACLDHGVDYVAINTSDPLEVVLSRYLSSRATRAVRGTGR